MNRELAGDYLRRMFANHTGYVAVACKSTHEQWAEAQFAWPDDRADLLAWAADHADGNVYVCPALRSEERRVKGDGIGLQWLWADVDWDKVPEGKRVEVKTRIEKLGTYVVASGTSDNVHVYVKLREEVTPTEHLHLNTGLRDYLYADHKQADNSLLRLPGTRNYKTPDAPMVGVVGGHGKRVSADQLRTWKAWRGVRITGAGDAGWTRADLPELPPKLRRLVTMASDEAEGRFGSRFKAEWAVTGELIKAGLSVDEIHTIMDQFPPALDKNDDENGAHDVHKTVAKRLQHDQDDEPPREAKADRKVRLVRASTFKIKRVQWGWQDRMPVGELCLIPGREGTGKSTFLAWLAAQITRGSLPGVFYGKPRPVLYAANEDAWEYTIAPRMLAAGADLNLLYKIEVDQDEDYGYGVSLPRDCPDVEELAKEVEAAAVMLDPIISVIDDQLSVNQPRELRKALEPLRRMAERAQVMVPALAHFNKGTDTDVLTKIPGARAWAEVARAAIGIARDEDEGHYVASQIKNNLGRSDLPNLTYTIESHTVPTEDGPADVGRLKWGEDSATSVQEIMDRKPDRRGRGKSDNTEEIIRWVRQRGEPVTLSAVVEHFDGLIESGTVSRTLQRAADSGELARVGRGVYGPLTG